MKTFERIADLLTGRIETAFYKLFGTVYNRQGQSRISLLENQLQMTNEQLHEAEKKIINFAAQLLAITAAFQAFITKTSDALTTKDNQIAQLQSQLITQGQTPPIIEDVSLDEEFAQVDQALTGLKLLAESVGGSTNEPEDLSVTDQNGGPLEHPPVVPEVIAGESGAGNPQPEPELVPVVDDEEDEPEVTTDPILVSDSEAGEAQPVADANDQVDGEPTVIGNDVIVAEDVAPLEEVLVPEEPVLQSMPEIPAPTPVLVEEFPTVPTETVIEPSPTVPIAEEIPAEEEIREVPEFK